MPPHTLGSRPTPSTHPHSPSFHPPPPLLQSAAHHTHPACAARTRHPPPPPSCTAHPLPPPTPLLPPPSASDTERNTNFHLVSAAYPFTYQPRCLDFLTLTGILPPPLPPHNASQRELTDREDLVPDRIHCLSAASSTPAPSNPARLPLLLLSPSRPGLAEFFRLLDFVSTRTLPRPGLTPATPTCLGFLFFFCVVFCPNDSYLVFLAFVCVCVFFAFSQVFLCLLPSFVFFVCCRASSDDEG